MQKPVEIKVHRALDEINPADWNRLAASSSIFYSYAWFKTFDRLLGQPLYLAAYRGKELQALLPGFVVNDPKTYLFHNHKDALFCANEIDAIDFLRRNGSLKLSYSLKLITALGKFLGPVVNRRMFPAFVAVSPRGFVGDFFYSDESSAIALLRHLDKVCEDLKIKIKAFLWVPNGTNGVPKVLSEAGYRKLLGELDFNLPVRWNSMQDLLNDLSSKRRRQVRLEMDNFTSAGLEVKSYYGGKFVLDELDSLVALAGQHARHCGDILAEEDIRQALMNLAGNFSEELYVFAAYRSNKLVGFCVGLRKNDTLYPKFEGYHQDFSRQTSLHFNLFFYQQMQEAISTRCKMIRYGSGDPQAKLVRGCDANTLNCYFASSQPTKGRWLWRKYLGFINKLKTNAYKTMSATQSWKLEG